MIEVTQKIDVYEIDEEELVVHDKFVEVNSHWNTDARVILKFDGKSVTVNASDLKTAIENATNTRRG